MFKKFKHVLVITLGLIGTAQNASAFQIQVDAQIQYNGSVSAEACNYSFNAPIFCRIYVRGTYLNGYGMEAWENAALYPGQCGWAYVYPAYGASYAASFGRADCRF